MAAQCRLPRNPRMKAMPNSILFRSDDNFPVEKIFLSASVPGDTDFPGTFRQTGKIERLPAHGVRLEFDLPVEPGGGRTVKFDLPGQIPSGQRGGQRNRHATSGSVEIHCRAGLFRPGGAVDASLVFDFLLVIVSADETLR